MLYDDQCGFCRWCVAQALRRSPRLIAVPIQSGEGQRILEHVPEPERLASVRTAGFGGLHSGGQAITDVLGELPRGRTAYKVARRLPRGTDLAYRLVARHRGLAGMLVSGKARRRADEYLARR